jgi:hypothetical protein
MFYFTYSTASYTPWLVAVNLYTDQVAWTLLMPAGGVDRLATSPDGSLLYVPSNEGNEDDYVNVVDTSTRQIVAQIHVAPQTHDTQDPVGDIIFQEVKSANPYLYMIDPTTYNVTQTGPFADILGPFVVDGTETHAVADVYNVRGFQVANLQTGEVVSAIVPDGEMFGTVLPHGLWWSPDQSLLLATTGHGSNAVDEWDMSNPMAPRFIGAFYLPTWGLPDGHYDIGSHWITGTINGDFAYFAGQKSVERPEDLGHPNVVVNINTSTIVGQIAPSGEMLEVDWNNGTVTQVGDQYANGQVRTPSPTPSTNLGNRQVSPTWSPLALAAATSYNLYRGTSSGGQALIATGVTDSILADRSVTDGTTYFYEATAVNSAVESTLSSEVSATAQAVPSGALVDAVFGDPNVGTGTYGGFVYDPWGMA